MRNHDIAYVCTERQVSSICLLTRSLCTRSKKHICIYGDGLYHHRGISSINGIWAWPSPQMATSTGRCQTFRGGCPAPQTTDHPAFLGGLRHPSPSPGPGSPGANSEPKLSGCVCVGGGLRLRGSIGAPDGPSIGVPEGPASGPSCTRDVALQKSNHLIFIYLCLIPTCARGRVFLAFLQVILSALVTWVETYDGTSHDLELDGGGNTTYSAPPKNPAFHRKTFWVN